MAHLSKKNGIYVVRFRFEGKEYKRSLKTEQERHAQAALGRVKDALHWLAINHLQVPEGVDTGEFIVSGGTLEKAPTQATEINPRTLQQATMNTCSTWGMSPPRIATRSASTCGT